MNLSLVVLTPGKMQGKAIPISIPQFLIGRDPDCHLRPSSPLISKRHCAVLIRDNQAIVKDLGSTNGTTVNNEAVTAERELRDDDHLKVGPLEFRVLIQVTVPVAKPAPVVSQTGSAAPSEDEAAAALLLSVQDDGPPPSSVDSQGIPEGSTVMESVPQSSTPPPDTQKPPPPDKAQAAKAAAGNTSSAAKAILEKYMRRPRTP
jgi:pSer/pThr/pTyr-binding forkhead associated (FHA) protein